MTARCAQHVHQHKCLDPSRGRYEARHKSNGHVKDIVLLVRKMGIHYLHMCTCPYVCVCVLLWRPGGHYKSIIHVSRAEYNGVYKVFGVRVRARIEFCSKTCVREGARSGGIANYDYYVDIYTVNFVYNVLSPRAYNKV